jgi:predicted DNA-binding antitoxin AbrB/MazE fold protein
MTLTFSAIYDGKVLKPEEPLDLEPNVHVRITIESLEKKALKTTFSSNRLFSKAQGTFRLVSSP